MELWQVPLSFSRLRMFPFFDLAHYVASVLALKEQRGVVEVSVRSPLACWFSAMLYCFGGSVLSSLMLGEPPVAFLAKTINILLASSVWYLVFYCPEDIFCRCFSFLPLRLLVAGMKEVTRTWKITDGIAHADIVYKDAWLVMVAVGWARGAGGGLISNFEQLVRGVWKPETNELLQMSYPVKATLIGAVLFSLQRRQYLPIARHNLMFLYTIFLVVFKWLLSVPPPEILEDVEDGGQYWNVLPVLLLSLGNHLELRIKGTHLFCHAWREISVTL
uniref:Transmembrane protein 38B n=1 Tax=Cyanistes caeruleus TaxID=156563 RepID=A0A8C0UK78_CYACU